MAWKFRNNVCNLIQFFLYNLLMQPKKKNSFLILSASIFLPLFIWKKKKKKNFMTNFV